MKTGHWLLTIALALLVAAPAAAQQPSIGVYFNTAGTQNTGVFNGGYDVTHTAYVIAFGEMLVGGAAFKVDLDPQVTLVNTAFPAGIQIGDLLNGVEIGFVDPVVGYFGVPVRLATMTLFTGGNVIANGHIAVVPFAAKYNDVLLSDANGELLPAQGCAALLTVPVAELRDSWGQVKGLYRP